MKVINPEELEGSVLARGIFRDVVNKDMGATKVRVQVQILRPGAGDNKHNHGDSEQCHYVVRGELTVTTKQGATVVRAGMIDWIPAGEDHQVHNSGRDDAHYLAITAPPPA